ncbi:MAG: glycosyltransferase family 4 protein [Cyclobacteriaceae bacterium]|nr:glycosyltransferase family 4 protein [Cyclobacteriaceae bacterium]
MRNDYRSVYVAFDPHPSYKGASTHIHHMCDVLAGAHPTLLLLTLKSNQPPIWTEHIHQYCFESEEENILKRATAFMRWTKSILDQQYNLVVGHFRDTWGGMAVLEFPHIRPLFEVNGLPSVELPYRYPYIAGETLQKILRMEERCLTKATAVITPSHTTKACLMLRGVEEEKITVIPNGAEVPEKVLLRPADLPEKYMVYVGALQPWQGVDVLLRALRYLQDLPVPLVICSSYTEHHAKPYIKFAEKIGVSDKVIWRYQLDKPALNSVLTHALFSVAPLTECSRNLEQGCSPLKILESMACGTPVIASQIPVVSEIISHDEDGILCRADRPAELSRTMRIAMDYPERTRQLGEQARRKIQQEFTWSHAHRTLQQVYDNVLTFSF